MKKLVQKAGLALVVMFAAGLLGSQAAQANIADVSLTPEGNAKVTYNGGEIDELGTALVVPYSSTLQKDLMIRLTNEGLDFLAKALKVNLLGLIPQSDYSDITAQRQLVTQMNDVIIGLWESFDLGGDTVTDILGLGWGCINFFARNRDYHDYETVGHACDCNGHHQTSPSFIGQQPKSCDNCWANEGGNPKFGSSYLAHNHGDGEKYDQRLTAADPYDPNQTVKNFYVGPYYREGISFHIWDPGTYPTGSNTDVFTSNDCMVNPSTAAYLGSGCDPRSPKIAIQIEDTGTEERLKVQLQLFKLRLHAQLALEFDCGDWPINPVCGIAYGICGGQWMRASKPGLVWTDPGDYIYARLYATFSDGFDGMLGQDGAEVGGGGGGGGSVGDGTGVTGDPCDDSLPDGTPASGTNQCAPGYYCSWENTCQKVENVLCDTTSEGGSGGNVIYCANDNQCPGGQECTGGECVAKVIPKISQSPLLGAAAAIDTAEGGCSWNGTSGFCVNGALNFNASGNSICDDILELLSGLIITDMIIPAVRDALGPLIGDLITGALGLPIDFNQLFAGGPMTKDDICAIKDEQTTTPSCSHGAYYGHGGNCACDDWNNDGVLNYADTDNHTSGGTGKNWKNINEDNLYFSGIVPNTIDSWNENDDYGRGNGLGGWVDLYGAEAAAPPFDIGAYLSTDFQTNEAAVILVDLAMQFAENLNGTNRNIHTYSCYGEGSNPYVETDPQQMDGNPLTRTHAADWPSSWSGLDTRNGTNHIIVGASQYSLEEFFHALQASGLLCLVVNDELLGGLGEILKIKNMKALIPGLDNNPALDPEDSVQILLRPTGVPTVRSLGGRTSAEFPAGDCIPDDGATNPAHRDGSADQNGLVLHNPGAPCAVGDNYDMAIVLPDMQLEFWMPETGTLTRIFRTNIDIVLSTAIEYTKSGPVIQIFSDTHSKYMEILADVWLGCEGEVASFGGLSDPASRTIDDCVVVNPASSLHDNVSDRGIASLLLTLLNAQLSLMLRTTFVIDGLTMEFNHIGQYPETGGDGDSSDPNVGKQYGYLGAGSGDWLAMAASLQGNLDLSKLFGLLGGNLAPTPYLIEPETYVLVGESSLAFGDPDAMPGTKFSLDPSQSAALGLRNEGSKMTFFSAPAVAKLDKDSDIEGMRYSYRIDGGAWTPFRGSGVVNFPYLVDGPHFVQVRAVDTDDYVDSSPAKVSFFVDSLPPIITLQNMNGQRHYAANGAMDYVDTDGLKIEVSDNVSDPWALRSSWSYDGKKWHPLYSVSGVNNLGLRKGTTKLYVQATDEFGNKSMQEFVLNPSEPESGWGFGCSATRGGPAGMLEMLLAGLLVAGAAARRRRKWQVN